MRIIVLDPALSLTAGHHFQLAEALIEEAGRHGIEIQVCGGRELGPEAAALGVRPVFEYSIYASVEVAPELIPVADHLLKNVALERDLRQGVEARFAADDLIVMHTLLNGQAVGLYRWYMSLPEPRPRVLLILRFPPWFRTEPHNVNLSIALFESALRPWAGLPERQVIFATDNVGLADYYGRLLGRPVPVLPIPIRHPERPVPARGQGGALTLCYMGEVRPEKGFHLLVGAMPAIYQAFGHVRFRLQCGRALGSLSDLVARARALVPQADYVVEDLSDAAYFDMMAAADAVLVPYDPDEYRLRTSHVMLEALGLGKPVLVTAGSWMDLELAQLGPAGVRAQAFTVEAIAEGLTWLVRSWPELKQAAEAVAPRCRARHNPGRFFEEMLALLER